MKDSKYQLGIIGLDSQDKNKSLRIFFDPDDDQIHIEVSNAEATESVCFRIALIDRHTKKAIPFDEPVLYSALRKCSHITSTDLLYMDVKTRSRRLSAIRFTICQSGE